MLEIVLGSFPTKLAQLLEHWVGWHIADQNITSPFLIYENAHNMTQIIMYTNTRSADQNLISPFSFCKNVLNLTLKYALLDMQKNPILNA